MAVGIDDAWDDRAAFEIDDPCARPGERAHLGRRARAEHAPETDRERLGETVVRVQCRDFSIHENKRVCIRAVVAWVRHGDLPITAGAGSTKCPRNPVTTRLKPCMMPSLRGE